MTGSDTLEMVRAARQGDEEACRRMITENSGLIWSVARRYFGQGTDPEDLYQLGCLGFIKAVQGFDESFGTQFSTYAVPKIAGEIRRFLRDDGTVKVSRSTRERAAFIRGAREKLCQRLGREPHILELSEFCELPVEEIAAAEIAVMPAESLQQENGDDGFTLENMLGTDGMEDGLVERIALREAVEALPEKERMVIVLRYYRGLTQEKVAQILGVSQVQVSRIERRAVSEMRKTLT